MNKNSHRTEALGALDELNSLLGLCKVKAGKTNTGIAGESLTALLGEVQQNLFTAQAEVAGSEHKTIDEEKVRRVEQVIDEIEKELPAIKHFSVPGGTELAAFLDFARAYSRKTERCVAALHKNGEKEIGEHTLAYLNRLSSLLFSLARLVNNRAGVKETHPQYK